MHIPSFVSKSNPQGKGFHSVKLRYKVTLDQDLK